MASAPLCRATPTGPAVSGSGTPSANGAVCACVFRKPRQFGPSRTTPAAAAWAISFCSSARPSAPTSRYPAASTTAFRTPAAAASSITLSTACVGARMKARSTGSPMSRRFRTAGWPKALSIFG